MAERIVLATPITEPTKTTASYELFDLLLDWRRRRIVIRLADNNGQHKRIVYQDPFTLSMLIGLNRANLTAKSLQRRIYERLIADGHLVGTIAGDPE